VSSAVFWRLDFTGKAAYKLFRRRLLENSLFGSNLRRGGGQAERLFFFMI
jgi:hypothetical protein